MNMSTGSRIRIVLAVATFLGLTRLAFMVPEQVYAQGPFLASTAISPCPQPTEDATDQPDFEATGQATEVVPASTPEFRAASTPGATETAEATVQATAEGTESPCDDHRTAPVVVRTRPAVRSTEIGDDHGQNSGTNTNSQHDDGPNHNANEDNNRQGGNDGGNHDKGDN